MSDRKSRTSEQEQRVVSVDGAMPDFVGATTAVVNGLSEVNGQILSFASQSFQMNIDAADEFRRCGNVQDMLDVQMRYAKRAYDSYVEEVRELGTLMARISSDAVAALANNRG